MKLFSIELNGVHTLPIFTDATLSAIYKERMNTILKEINDHRELNIQICDNYKSAYQMLDTIATYYTDLYNIIIDPNPPRSDNMGNDEIRIVENIKPIDEIIDDFRRQSASNTP